MGKSASSNAGERRRSGLSTVIATYLPLFSLNFCGLIAVRIWIQCNLYDRYASTDSGIITIVANLTRVALILILIFIVMRRGFSEKAQMRLGYASLAMMAAASLLFLVNSESPNQAVLWAACILAGCGIVWGGGIWMCLYIRMQPDEALLYAFLSLGVSSLFGFFLGIMPESITYLICVFMPVLSMLMYQRAQKDMDAREAAGTQASFASTSSYAQNIDAQKDAVYDKEPRSTFIRLIAGIVLFNLALGIARGFPSGESIALPLPFQAVHQVSVFLLSLGLIWWTVGKARSIRFSALWNISVTLIVIGVLVLAAANPLLDSIGATLIAISNTFAVGLLWFSCYDVARHSSIPSYIILGVGWAAHILPRELGRAGIWLLEPHTVGATAIAAVMVVLLALSMVLLLNDSIPTLRPLFAEFRGRNARAVSRSLNGDAGVQVMGAGGDLLAEDGGDAAAPEAERSDGSDALEARIAQLQRQYALTARETEVVRLLAQGRSRANIGLKLYISENTVRTYVKSIYAKLDIHSKQELLDRLEGTDL